MTKCQRSRRSSSRAGHERAGGQRKGQEGLHGAQPQRQRRRGRDHSGGVREGKRRVDALERGDHDGRVGHHAAFPADVGEASVFARREDDRVGGKEAHAHSEAVSGGLGQGGEEGLHRG